MPPGARVERAPQRLAIRRHSRSGELAGSLLQASTRSDPAGLGYLA